MYVKNKDWYKSKTVLASAAALLIAIATAAFGATDPIVALLIAIASGTGIYGRVTSTTQIKQ